MPPSSGGTQACTGEEPQTLKRLTVSIGGMVSFLGIPLFLAAGTIGWMAGWVFLALCLGFAGGLGCWLYRHNPGLLAERLAPIGKAGQRTWDKVFLALINGYFLAWLILMGIDAVRFHWSVMPPWLHAIGGMLLVASFAGWFAIFRENPYLSPAVRMQPERGHVIVTTGPYRWVRHPMYAVAIPFMMGTALWLGSWYGLIAGWGMVVGLGWRALGEERMLSSELAGYRSYRAQVKYRFVPHIW